jgi:O-methyltransferase involved in polyketide biosynthesis
MSENKPLEPAKSETAPPKIQAAPPKSETAPPKIESEPPKLETPAPANVEKGWADLIAPPVPASSVAQDTHEQDKLGMGRTAGQRTAEVFAGLRAELLNTPEANALASRGGHIAAQVIKAIGTKKVLNFVPVRLGAFAGLTKKALGKDVTGKVLVEIAAGFSPRGLALAKELPALRVIEVDLPDVVAEKQQRLEKGKFEIPSNISWKQADLGVQPLSEVLGQERVDVVTAEGLLPYFEYAEITRIAKQIYQSLKVGGVFIADLGFTDAQGAQEAGTLVRLFRRFTSSSPGSVTDEATAFKLFRDAGYDEVELYRMPQAAELFSLPQPVSDVLFFMVAHRQK